MSEDRRRKACDQILNNCIFIGHANKLIFVVVVEDSQLILEICLVSVIFKYAVRYQIDVGVKYWFHVWTCSLHFYRLGTIDPYYLYSVSRSNSIHVGVIAKNGHWIWSLSLRNVFRQLLEFNELLIGKLTHIVYNFKHILHLTIFTLDWFFNLGIFQHNMHFRFAIGAPKQSFLHFRIDLRTANNNPSKADKFINIFGSQVSNEWNLIQILYPHH